MTFLVLDPTHETSSDAFELAPRLKTLEGQVVGFVSNGKEGTAAFFDHLDSFLRIDVGVAQVVRLVKPNYSVPADPGLIAQAAD